SNDVILTNRLGTDPYARWCERTDREIIPIFLLDLGYGVKPIHPPTIPCTFCNIFIFSLAIYHNVYTLGYMNLNQDFDVIVIGSGISGGWAAKEFCEKGFKTLVIERGRMVKHVEDYPTANMDLWEFEHRNAKSLATMRANPIVG